MPSPSVSSGSAAAELSALLATAAASPGWRLDREARQLHRPDGSRVALSDAEARLVNVLLQAPQRVFSREQLASLAHGQVLAASGRSIDLLVSRLRQKLANDAQAPRCIQTVRGAGYVFDAAPGRPSRRRPWAMPPAAVSGPAPAAG